MPFKYSDSTVDPLKLELRWPDRLPSDHLQSRRSDVGLGIQPLQANLRNPIMKILSALPECRVTKRDWDAARGERCAMHGYGSEPLGDVDRGRFGPTDVRGS